MQNKWVAIFFLLPLWQTMLPLFPHFPHLLPPLLPNHQVLQQMALGSTTTPTEHGGGLLECTHTHHGQHLFMNGPTIAHPPTATADRGRGTPQVTKSKRRDKEDQCSQSSRRERKEKRGQQSWASKYVLWFLLSLLVRMGRKQKEFQVKTRHGAEQLTMCISCEMHHFPFRISFVVPIT